MTIRNLNPLPAIAEDRNSFQIGDEPSHPPTIPPRAWNRPISKLFAHGQPPRLHQDSSPPAYSQFDSHDVEGPNGEKLVDVRKAVVNNRHIARRGGWKKLVLIVLLVSLCIVALVVGLVVGLRNRKNKPLSNESMLPGGASGSSNVPGSTSNQMFPAGTYRIQTVLSSSTTNCTSNPSIWTCYPYTTYSVSQTQSRANFDWIISPSTTSESSYTISTTQNIFTIMFSNITLTLMNKGDDNEHYTFDMPLNKNTRPATPLGTSNAAASCDFSNSMLKAELYTKIGKTLNDTESEGGMSFKPWPYMVRIEQFAASDAGIPKCVDPSGNSLGDFSAKSGQCSCEYVNAGM